MALKPLKNKAPQGCFRSAALFTLSEADKKKDCIQKANFMPSKYNL
jgi:hypothetical protein